MASEEEPVPDARAGAAAFFARQPWYQRWLVWPTMSFGVFLDRNRYGLRGMAVVGGFVAAMLGLYELVVAVSSAGAVWLAAVIGPLVLLIAAAAFILGVAYWSDRVYPRLAPLISVTQRLLLSGFAIALLLDVAAGLSAIVWSPPVGVGEAEAYYVWHLLDSVPLLDIPGALGWREPASALRDHGNVILLVLELVAIGPVAQLAVGTYHVAEGARLRFRGTVDRFSRRADEGFFVVDSRWWSIGSALTRTALLTAALFTLADPRALPARWLAGSRVFGWAAGSPWAGLAAAAVFALAALVLTSARMIEPNARLAVAAAFVYAYSLGVCIGAGLGVPLLMWLCLTSLALIVGRQNWNARRTVDLFPAIVKWTSAQFIMVCFFSAGLTWVIRRSSGAGGAPPADLAPAAYGTVWWHLIALLPGPDIPAILHWSAPLPATSTGQVSVIQLAIVAAVMLLAFPLGRAIRTFMSVAVAPRALFDPLSALADFHDNLLDAAAELARFTTGGATEPDAGTDPPSTPSIGTLPILLEELTEAWGTHPIVTAGETAVTALYRWRDQYEQARDTPEPLNVDAERVAAQQVVTAFHELTASTLLSFAARFDPRRAEIGGSGGDQAVEQADQR
jgi:hypothetical protein